VTLAAIKKKTHHCVATVRLHPVEAVSPPLSSGKRHEGRVVYTPAEYNFAKLGWRAAAFSACLFLP